MRIDRTRRGLLCVTAQVNELAALLAAARWAVAEERDASLAPEAREHLRRVIASYERAVAALPRERTLA